MVKGCWSEVLFFEGWLTSIGKALDKLKRVSENSFNAKERFFTFTYDSSVVSKDSIIKTVEGAGNFKVKDWTPKKESEPKD